MLNFLARSRAFFVVVAFLLLLAGINLYVFRYDFSVLARQVWQKEDAEVARWQRWARHYGRLFAMLGPGERVGIQLEGYRSSGILLEPTSQGVVARRSLFLRRERPGVILTFQRGTADKFLGTAPGTDPEAIWQMMKDALYGRQITVWNDPDIDWLQRGGYLAFIRAIDTRPPNVDWTTVKGRLGEK